MQCFNSNPGVSMQVGRLFRLRYNCCVRENYRAVLRGDRLEWEGDGPVVDGGVVAVEVTVLRDAPSRSEQGAKMAPFSSALPCVVRSPESMTQWRGSGAYAKIAICLAVTDAD